MKIVVFILSFLFIQTAVSQVTRQNCLDSGIKDSSVPQTIPVENPVTDDPCEENSCCTSGYIADLRENIQIEVFKECVKDSLDDLVDIAEDFFDDFADSFGDFARNAIFSSFSVRAGVGNDTSEVYIDNELTYSSELLANLTFERIRGDKDNEDDEPRFLTAIREYACDYLASLIQKRFYPTSLRLGRLTGSCICQLEDDAVGTRIDTIIDSILGRYSSTIDNIANLVRAISLIRDISLQNLRTAQDFNVSSICTRQFIKSIACQHCQGNDTRACPESCRIVSFLCLQPLRQAFANTYETFIMYVRLALESIIGNNLNSIGRFDFHDLQEITGELNSGLKDLEMSVTTLLRERISSGKTILNSTCFVTRTKEIEEGKFKCQDDSDRDDSVPDCTREDGDREIVDDRTDNDTRTANNNGGDMKPDEISDNSGTDTDSDEDDRREDDDFDRTSEEDDFVSFVKKLLARFDVYGNFNSIFTRINKCVCRASQSVDTEDDDDDRLMTLYVAPIDDDSCFRRFTSDFTTDNIEDNPAYISLTEDEKRQVDEFDAEVSARFTQLAQFVDNDESISSTFEQLTGGASDAGRLLTNLLLVLASAFFSILFVMV